MVLNVLRFLLVTALAATAACEPELVERREQTVRVVSDPPGAAVFQLQGTTEQALGPAPVSVALVYEVVVSRFPRWWWALPAGVGLAWIALMAFTCGRTRRQETLRMSAGLVLMAIFAGLLYVGIRGELQGGERLRGGQAALTVGARLPGRAEARATLAPGAPAELRLALPPAAGGP